jgi:DNA-binding MarR family transcriptional regulator
MDIAGGKVRHESRPERRRAFRYGRNEIYRNAIFQIATHRNAIFRDAGWEHSAVITMRTRDKRDLSKPDYERLAEFRYLLRRFLVFSESAAGEAGLTAQQHQALLAIKGFPGREQVTIGELAERLGIRHHSAVGLIDRLAANSLVKRSDSADDKRQVLISLTRKADSLLATLSVAHHAELERLAPLLQALLGQFEREGKRARR